MADATVGFLLVYIAQKEIRKRKVCEDISREGWGRKKDKQCERVIKRFRENPQYRVVCEVEKLCGLL